jgi:cation transport regulator
MPYQTNVDLPHNVHAHLPAHVLGIYREAFNHAFASHAGEVDQKERAHRLARAAVKRSYVQSRRSLGAAPSVISLRLIP